MPKFEVVSEYQPSGDQPQAIAALAEGIENGLKEQVLLGVTGSGKTFTMAKVIEQVQRPTLVLAHNKTLAAQLCAEFKEFFPNNAVEYFVSYYDYYQPEAYIPHTDTYIAKDASTNDEIDRLRLSATCALLERGISVALASDPAPSRLRGLETALTRLSLPRPELSCSPAQALAPALAGRFPLILLDVPCSGTGTLARNPELRLRLGLKRRTGLSSLQTELLDAAWGALAPDGLLAYATCALRREENEKRIASFLASRTDAFLRTQTLIAPDFPGQDVLFIALIRKN